MKAGLGGHRSLFYCCNYSANIPLRRQVLVIVLTSASLEVAGLKRLWIQHTRDWHISGDERRRSVADSVAREAENAALERRSRVRGSVVGPFSHVALLLSCVVSLEFEQLITSSQSTHIH